MHEPMLQRRHWLAAAGGFAASLAAPGIVRAAAGAWPERPIRIVVPSSPGGSADAVARLVGERLALALGQPVVIDNKGGGGGNIATEAVAKSPADGYTLLLTGNNHTVNVSLFARPPYKLADFAPIVELTRGPSVFVAGAKAPFSTLAEMIELAAASRARWLTAARASACPATSRWSCSSTRPASAWCMCPTRARGPR